jgi:hypothetical protein
MLFPSLCDVDVDIDENRVGRMGSVADTTNAGIMADIPWKQMLEGKEGLVDVGGGRGTLCCDIATM